MNPQPDHDERIRNADGCGEDQKAGDDGQDSRRIAVDQAGSEAGDQTDCGSDRQVDARSEDRQCLAQADQQEIGRLFGYVEQIVQARETLVEIDAEPEQNEK